MCIYARPWLLTACLPLAAISIAYSQTSSPDRQPARTTASQPAPLITAETPPPRDLRPTPEDVVGSSDAGTTGGRRDRDVLMSNADATGANRTDDGSVSRALRKLHRIPRRSSANDEAADEAARASEKAGASHGQAVVPARGDAPPAIEPRMGMQHADAIHESVSSVPVGDDLRQPPGDGYIVPGPDGEAVVVPREDLHIYHHPDVEYREEGPYFSPYDPRVGYYRFGFYDGSLRHDRTKFRARAHARTESILSSANIQLHRGLEAFRAGEYRAAAKQFKLAAELNQGDPASRLYATHALFAIGRYTEAVKYLRRALSLEPRIALLTFDIRDDYGEPSDFERHLSSLRRALRIAPANMDRLALLGYVLNYTDRPDEAYEVLAKARQIDHRDRLVQQLHESTHPPDGVE